MIERFRQEEIMSKVFNTTAVCIPEEHYMVNIAQRLQEIKALVDDGKYFTINKARQYGKTTTLIALKRLLESEYYVVLMDFQTFLSVIHFYGGSKNANRH